MAEIIIKVEKEEQEEVKRLIEELKRLDDKKKNRIYGFLEGIKTGVF